MQKNGKQFSRPGKSQQQASPPAPREDRAGAGARPYKGGNSFAARFGRVLLLHGIAALPTALYRYQAQLDLYAQHVWFVSFILSYKWDEDLPYPSLGVMAKCSGISKRQLQRYSDELQRTGYLQVFARISPNGGQGSNSYDFGTLFEHLERYIASDQEEGNSRPNSIRAEGPEPQAVAADQEDWSFVARYGRVVARYGVAAVPTALFTQQSSLELEPQQVWFVVYILSYQWDTSLPYPSITRMAQQTGYTAAYLHRIKNSLVELGYLRLVHRTNSQGGQDSNAYDFSALFDAMRNLLQPQDDRQTGASAGSDSTGDVSSDQDIEAPLQRARRGSMAVRARADRQVGSNSAGLQTHPSGDTRYPPPGDAQYIAPGDTQYSPPDDAPYIEGSVRVYPAPGDTLLSGKVSRRAQAPVTRSKQDVETSYPEEEKKKKIDSNRRSSFVDANEKTKTATNNSSKPGATSGATSNATSHTKKANYSAYIAQVVTDFSRELGDDAHVVSNVSQALRLWSAAGLDEEAFVQLMYGAKQRTRGGQNASGMGGINNKMGYFFICLRSILDGPA